MQIRFSKDRDFILFISDKAVEYSGLYKFAGLLKDGTTFYIPAKTHIAFNVITRIRNQFKNVLIEQSVLDFINSEFSLKKLPPDFKYFTKPLPFQDIALRYLYTVGSGGLLLDPGMGKSKVVLDFIALMKFKKTVIVCPKPLIFVWEDEVESHRPDLKVYVVGDLEPEKVVTLVENEKGKMVKKTSYVMDREKAWAKELEKMKDSNVIVINYNKAVTFKEELRSLNFDFIHIDEFLIKDHSTERTKAITSLSDSIPYKCGGSGTLINNSVLDMFAPVRYLEKCLVGGNFSHFQDRYAVRKGPKDSHVKFTVGFKNIPEARSILESCCIVMTKAEWLKLPDKTFHRKYVQISDDQRRVYDELSRNYITTFQGSSLEIDNALVMLSKLYQISNGFLYITKEAEGLDDILPANDGPIKTKKKPNKASRETKFFSEQPKIQALNALLDNELKFKKSIIWFNMEAEYTLIKKLLENRGDSFLTIKGGETGTGAKVRLFNKTPSIRWLVCQAKSVNYGITVLGTSLEKLESSDVEVLPNVSTEVSDEVFYSINYSLEVFLQQQDRIHRIGQNNKCNYWLLLANTSVEHSIKEAIDNKMTIREDMLIDIAHKLKERY